MENGKEQRAFGSLSASCGDAKESFWALLMDAHEIVSRNHLDGDGLASTGTEKKTKSVPEPAADFGGDDEFCSLELNGSET